MFLYKESAYIRTAKLNKRKYEKDLKTCEKLLKNSKIPLKYKTDYLIERGNLLLRIVPSRGSYEQQMNCLEEAKKTYKLAKKSVNSFKKRKDLERAINQIEKKQNSLSSPDWIEDILKDFNFLKLSIFAFVLACFFSIINLTGAVVGSAKQDFFILGIIFFILGLVGAFVYVRSKK